MRDYLPLRTVLLTAQVLLSNMFSLTKNMEEFYTNDWKKVFYVKPSRKVL